MKFLKAVSKESGLELADSRRNKFNFDKGVNETTVLSPEDFKEYIYNSFVDECNFIECEAKLR